MSNTDMHSNLSSVFAHSDLGSSSTTPTSECPPHYENPDSLFLIAFAARSPFRPQPQPHSARSSFSSEWSESEDRKYTLFGSDLDDEDEPLSPQSPQSPLPVWPEELQYVEEPSYSEPLPTPKPRPVSTYVSTSDLEFGYGIPRRVQSTRGHARSSSWKGTIRKLFLTRKAV